MELSLAQTDEPYRRELTTEVVDCRPADGEGYRVRLAETIFYPEGGGQPADFGRIDAAEVLDVQRGADGEILHRTDSEVASGTVELEIDWERRFDHMQQHTAQHLLTAVADDEFDLPTVSFHLGETYSSIALDTARVSDPVVRQIEQRVNAEIREARPVRFAFVSRDEYDEMEVRSRGLPDEHDGEVRVVEIDGIDRNTCGGTHVTNTAELQAIKVTGLERTRDRVRLEYLAGGRVLDRLGGCLEREEALNDLLSCGRDEHVDAVGRALEEAQTATNRVAAYQEELAELIGVDLARRGDGVLEAHRDDPDFRFLNAIARAAREAGEDPIVFLTATEPGITDEGIFVLNGPESLVAELGDEVAERLDGRGGGPPGRYQGKASKIGNRDDVIDFLSSHL